MNFGHNSNFDKKKRLNRQIKLIVFHYTGMQSKVAAFKKLYSPKSKVSCHYLIDEIGNITKIVPEKLETSEEYILSTQDVEVNYEAPSNEIEKPISQIENVIKPEQNITPINVISMEFGKELVNRELVGVDSVFYLSDDRIYALSKIQNRSGARTLFHEWYHEGKLRSKISMEVGRSYNWRTWSYIEVRPNIVGNWEVFVSDSLGVNYDSLSFQVKATTIKQE